MSKQNSRWYKTLSNCYVPEAQIEFVDADLDDCGPIPFMEEKMREPDPAAAAPETPASNFSSSSVASRRDVQHDSMKKNKRWLYLTQIGYDSANCLALPASNSKIRKTYHFGAYIVVQCATYSEGVADNNQLSFFFLLSPKILGLDG